MHGGKPAQILLAESAIGKEEIQRIMQRCGDIDTLCLRDTLFRELSGVAAPVGIAALIDIPKPPSAPSGETCVLLDAVQDAGNVGSILRTAAAAGVKEVLLGAGCAGAWTPRVLRAGQGAHFALAIREQVDLHAFATATALPTIATVAREGTVLYELDLNRPVVWLFGNEGAGLSAHLIEAAALRVRIPLAAQTESLNVAAAAAICLFEGLRQRL